MFDIDNYILISRNKSFIVNISIPEQDMYLINVIIEIEKQWVIYPYN